MKSRATGATLVLLVALAAMPLILDATSLLDVEDAVGLALFACATNLLIGYGGLVSFGQAAFYGVGAYTVALMWMHWHASFWAGLVAAPFLGAIAALLVGLIALRTRRLYFALLTLAFSQLFYTVVLQQQSFTGGANGVFGSLLPAALTKIDSGYWFTLAVVAVALLLLWMVTRSPFGLTLRAIRENRQRAEALGINVFAHQLLAFVIAGAFCALAGTLFVVHDSSANPNLFSWTESGYPVFMAVIGGQYLFIGPVLGAFVYELGADSLAGGNNFQLVFGVLLLIVVLFAPDGVLGLLVRLGSRRGRSIRAGVVADPDRAEAAAGAVTAASSGDADPAVAQR